MRNAQKFAVLEVLNWQTKKIKQLEKILIAVGIALLAVVIICIVVFSRADKVSAPEAIPVLTTTTTTTHDYHRYHDHHGDL